MLSVLVSMSGSIFSLNSKESKILQTVILILSGLSILSTIILICLKRKEKRHLKWYLLSSISYLIPLVLILIYEKSCGTSLKHTLFKVILVAGCLISQITRKELKKEIAAVEAKINSEADKVKRSALME